MNIVKYISPFICSMAVGISLIALVSSLSGCAAMQAARKHGLETNLYVNLGWLQVDPKEIAEISGYKRLENEIEFSTPLKAFIIKKGLPDYLRVPKRKNPADIRLLLAYLREGKVYELDSSPFGGVIGTHNWFDVQLPADIRTAFQNSGNMNGNQQDTASLDVSSVFKDAVTLYNAKKYNDAAKSFKKIRELDENYKSEIVLKYIVECSEQLKTDSYNAPPEIEIKEPDEKRVLTKKITVAGRTKDTDGIYEVSVNGIEAHLQSDGYFQTDIPLAIGDNTISIKATDTKMKSAYSNFIVKREIEPTVTGSQVNAKLSGDQALYRYRDSNGVIHFSNRPNIGNTLYTKTKGSAAPKKISINEKEKTGIKNSYHEKRLALVIGNANYTYGGNLKNPVNDAKAMKKTLEDLGFTVIEYKNSSQKTMKRAIDEFGTRLKDYSIGLFFYAGHGVQVKGNNYLVPVDAKLENENDAEYDTVRADRVLAKMESARTETNIVILDACRDNPFERSWRRGVQGNGLAFMNAPSGSIIAYATSPGNTASDGIGMSNGLYTSAILKHIKTPNITIEQMFKQVRSTIMERSDNKQIPWESTSLRGDFYFKRE